MAKFIMFGGCGFWLCYRETGLVVCSHNLCALGSRQTLAIIMPQFIVCYGIKLIFFL